MPIAPVEIILGALAGYFGLIGHSDMFKLVSEIGFFYLMFLAGTEVDLKIFFTMDKKILRTGLLYVALLYLLSVVVTFGLNLDKLFILIIPIMSVGMIFTLFKEYGKDKDWLNLGMLIGFKRFILVVSAATYHADALFG